MSIAGGLHKALERGASIGCETIQLFTRNSNRWKSKPRTEQELEQFREVMTTTGIEPVVAHAIYLINMGSPDGSIRAKSNDGFAEELDRCQEAGIPYLVIHPGSHRGSGLDLGISRIAAGIKQAYQERPNCKVVTLLENTAGQGDTIGRNLEELAQLYEAIDLPEKIGYCLDTAHALASGYDLRSEEGYHALFERFEALLGLERLFCFHLNDSMADVGEERDRHEQIGKGHLGLEAFRMLLNDPRFKDYPMLLETPKSQDMHEDVENLALLRSLIKKV
jgi:deoxyribonuclease-4